MMVKIFTTDKKDQITLTTKELKELLDEAYWEGYRANKTYTYTYTSPSWSPWTLTTTDSNITITSNLADQITDQITSNLASHITLNSNKISI